MGWRGCRVGWGCCNPRGVVGGNDSSVRHRGHQPWGCPNGGVQHHPSSRLGPAAASERHVVSVHPVPYLVLGKSLGG